MRVHTDRRCLEHEAPPGFPERPERLARILAALGADPRFEVVETGAPGDEEVLAAVRELHDPRYVARFERAVARGDGLIDTADNPLSAGSWRAALGAVAATLAALDQAMEGRSVFAAVRPPGHHAELGHAMGFCYFGNAALAAARALRRHGLSRVAVVDVDVHHGNGTQHLFEERADVFYASAHQYPFYPGTGAAAERGRGAGEGFTLNVPLAVGAGDVEWRGALEATILPALERFVPELLVVSAGFDAWRADPLGGMRVTEAGFGDWGRLLRDAAERLCGGRRLVVLEGGYDLDALPELVKSFLLA